MTAARHLAGYVPDLPDLRDRPADAILRSTPLLADIDLRPFLPSLPNGTMRRDQGQTGSCVGQATAYAFDARARIKGIHAQPISALATYSGARALLGQQPPYADTGTTIRAAATWLAKHGVCAEERWAALARVNDALPLDVLQHSIDARAAGYRRVFETGWSRVDAVKTALSAGYPVVFGQVVDDTFLNYGGGVMGAHDGTYRGGHATTIMGYDRAGNFLAVNSWGDSWGEMGDYRFVPERLASAFVVDCWILTLDGDEPRVS